MQLTWGLQINLHGKLREDGQVHLNFAGLYIFIPKTPHEELGKKTLVVYSLLFNMQTLLEQHPVLVFYEFYFSTFLQTAPITKVLKLTGKVLEFTQMWAFMELLNSL